MDHFLLVILPALYLQEIFFDLHENAEKVGWDARRIDRKGKEPYIALHESFHFLLSKDPGLNMELLHIVDMSAPQIPLCDLKHLIGDR